MFVCEDYSAEQKDRLWLDVRIVEVTTSDGRDDAVKAFQSLASASGAVFPVVLPYTAVAASLAKTIDSVLDAVESDPLMLLSAPIELYPAGSQNRVQLQSGRYVAFPEEADGTQFQLQPNGVLTSGSGKRVETPYVVIRVDTDQEVTPDVLVPQRIATLLTHGRSKQRPY